MAVRSTAGLVAAGLAGALLLAPGATASTPRTPVPSVRLPGAAEQLSPYLPEVSCDPHAKPGVVAFERLMLATFRRGSSGGIVRACGDGGVSEHKEGRAWDWMLDSNDPVDHAVAYRALHWLLKPGPHGEPAWNARRFGLMYVIWDGRIWSSYRWREGWRAYRGVSEHRDHIHFSFSWAGAWKRTSWWTGHVARVDYGPCPARRGFAARYSHARLVPCGGAAGPGAGVHRPPVYAWPGDHGARVVALQHVLGIRPATGYFGPRTRAKISVFQARHHLAVTGVANHATALALRLVRPPHRRPPLYAWRGLHGARVVALQHALRVHPATGYFGPRTERAVRIFQSRHHLPVTGIVNHVTAVRMHLLR
jgi:peptidoglycan hydrolase-like protein with peptidoglycan-binding domain